MSRQLKQTHNSLRRTPIIGGVLLALFLFVLAMAQFETLHELCHADAGHADHHCVVTTLTSGMVDAPAPEVEVDVPPVFAIAERIPAAPFVSSVNSFLLPSRGPPAFLA